MTLNTNQLDLFSDAPFTPILGNVTDRPAKRFKSLKALTLGGDSIQKKRVAKKLNAVMGSTDLIERTIEDSATILKNLGCEYIIMMGNGRVFEHGELPVKLRQQAAPATPKKPKRSSPGTFSHHYKPIIENLAVGTVAFVPFKTSTGVNLSVPQLNSAITAWMARQWGSESSTTHINRKLKGIEVLRLK